MKRRSRLSGKKPLICLLILILLLLISLVSLLSTNSALNSSPAPSVRKEEGNTPDKPAESAADPEKRAANTELEDTHHLFAPVSPPPPSKRVSVDGTTLWVDAEMSSVYVTGEPMPADETHTVQTARYPKIEFRDRNDATIERETTTHGKPLGHSHVEWETIYNPSDSFKFETWANGPERHTLEHASIFVSIAAFRDEECAGTLLDIFTQSRSPHRIYAGISEEREDSDVRCLELMDLDRPKAAAALLYGERARNLPIRLTQRRMSWKEVMEHRRIQLVPNAVKELKGGTAPPSGSCECTTREPSNLVYHCKQRLQHSTRNETANETSTTDASESTSDPSSPYYCIVADENIADVKIDPKTGQSITDVKMNKYLCVPDHKMLQCVAAEEPCACTRASGVGGEDDTPSVVYLDSAYEKEQIECVAGNLETTRDEFLLALHGLLPVSHPNFDAYGTFMKSLEPAELKKLQENFAQRKGRGGPQQELTHRLAGCRITTRVTPSGSARGPTYGRFITSLFYSNQDYYMIVDSHSRFSIHWDNKMILRVFQMPTPGVLSHYPNGYLPDKPRGEFHKRDVMGMCKGVILANGMPKLGANWMAFRPHPTLEAFAAAGYLFGDAQFALDNPFDPFLHYLFDGEEILYSVRMWTSGWDIYCPAEANIFHFYGRPGAPKFWSLMTPAKNQAQVISEKRALYLLERAQPWVEDKQKYPGKDYVPPSERRIVTEEAALHSPRIMIKKKYYGLGEKRTLEAFWEFSELSDKFVTTKDNENRWEGGQSLCKKQHTA